MAVIDRNGHWKSCDFKLLHSVFEGTSLHSVSRSLDEFVESLANID